jgi:L-ascorbate metabolism protein UlaG (beta-lactamase superfamily)
MTIEITWFGGATFRLKTGKGRTIFIDPWLDAPPGNAGCSIGVKDVKDADLVMVTHGDPGHYGRGDGVRIAAQSGCPYASNEPLCNYVVKKGLLPAGQARPLKLNALNHVGDVEIFMFPIVHPPWTPPAGYEIPREPNTGFAFTVEGTTLLFAGDTVPGDEIYRSVGRDRKPTIGILPIGSPIGSHGTLEATALTAAAIVEMTGVRQVIPHYNWGGENPAVDMLRNALAPLGAELVSLQPGGSVRVGGEAAASSKRLASAG